ncbi:alpha-L-fucosidase [Pullulanibacillus pueri]|uniref:alpha-L-fucosidase n=1 Tax=Pullulanibacillus pueri TaxID=1437324 RepID=A0A8J3EM58_9BACL|nr:alpha-L-fucosidase [Pullulanibacillus pueri]MBM7680916.1 alpha-L-fucosidase [Pullulanibacillus pueri]GGH81322.1 hypothetical protein GCM10007096_19050 [Pullulanibacillus pueri]
MTEQAVPTQQQSRWQDLELGMFFHFGINTFYDQEWGTGEEDPKKFNPSDLDARQWVRIAKQAGFKYIILTAKHHDGFCLWPTTTTEHSVKSSPWKQGKGDVVGEVATACQEEGLLFGLYLSPWDRHEPCYKDKNAYDDFYCQQLTELLTQYGPLVEVWFDGAGSEGRQYDWRRIIDLVERYQPEAMVFNMGRPTIRWAGNEDGVAPYPNWNSSKTARLSLFTDSAPTWLPDTPEWLPSECDVPIRNRHWFWRTDDEHNLKSLEELMDIYYRSVGHGANLLLNVAPDKYGLIPEIDAERVIAFGQEIKSKFAQPLSETSGKGNVITLQMDKPILINHVILKEDITYGERVRKYRLEYLQDGDWKEVFVGTAVGHKKIDSFDPIVTNQLRLMVTEAIDTPIIKQLACFDINNQVGH